MGIEAEVRLIRTREIKESAPGIPDVFQGIAKERIRAVLSRIGRQSDDIVDAVFALLDPRPSWFRGRGTRGRFCDGATTAHIACHVGILQRNGVKLDREGRDFWIKPLREVGAVEPVTRVAGTGEFIDGHPVAKSPVCAYRLAATFVELLRTPEGLLDAACKRWISVDHIRMRLELQAAAAARVCTTLDRKHESLIEAAGTLYVPHFLPGYEMVYIDAGDGERVPGPARDRLRRAGIDLRLGDAMPDILLWHPERDAFWVIEAVTSDGEVDHHKVAQVRAMIDRAKKGAPLGFTTVYGTWREAAGRQGKMANLAPDTWMWIQADASKQFRVTALGAAK